MSVLKTVLFLVYAMMFSGAAWGSALQVNTNRLVRIEGEVSSNAINAGRELQALVGKSKAPIYVLLNSAGGSVLAGLQFVDSMKAAQSQGVRVRCFVTNIAMSMAFYIYSECSERYSMRYSLLLFHPMRLVLQGSYKPTELVDLARDGTLLETPLIYVMVRHLGMPREKFMRHYNAETIWTSEMLNVASPGFTQIVTNFGAFSFLPVAAP